MKNTATQFIFLFPGKKINFAKTITLTLLLIFITTSISQSQIASPLPAKPKINYHFQTSKSPGETNTKPENFTAWEKALNISVGFAFGAIIGWSIGHKVSDDEWAGAFRGAFIGASIGPMLTYEFMALDKNIHPGHENWSIKTGFNYTCVDRNNLKYRTGFLVGMSRDYRTNKFFPFRMDVFYTSKQFTLQSQDVQHYISDENWIKQGDINFAVHYVDISLLAGIFSIDKSKLKLYAGPSLSVPVYDNIEYVYSHSERTGTSNYHADFHYIDYEPSAIPPFLSIAVNFSYEINKFILESRYKHNFHRTAQIFPLWEEVRLNCFE